MKVKELIEQLSKCDSELEVMKGDCYTNEIEYVREVILNRSHDDLPNIEVVVIN